MHELGQADSLADEVIREQAADNLAGRRTTACAKVLQQSDESGSTWGVVCHERFQV
jgi:hypothetical protein